MAIDAAVRDVDLPAAINEAGFRSRVNVGRFLIHLRIEMTNLRIWDRDEPGPRKRERAEDAQDEWRYTFHGIFGKAASSCGLRNVGTVAVRPRPNSIMPK